jgi:hypothetical protein
MSAFVKGVGIVTLFVVIGLAAISTLGKNASGTFSSVGQSIGSSGSSAVARNEKKAEPKEAAPKQPEAPEPEDEVQRRIIYTARATLAVEDFEQSNDALRRLVREHKKAFIANSHTSGSPGVRRTGNWTIRVPAEQLESFFDEVGKLGEVHERALDSQDITEQYYDRENRLKNKLARQEALRQMLKQSTARKEDYLAVDRELNQMTQDIEADLGQLRLWRSLSDLATVHLTVRERHDYVPPQSLPFGATVARTFSGSLDALLAVGRALVLIIVALAPWLPIIALVAPPLYLILRRTSEKTAGAEKGTAAVN